MSDDLERHRSTLGVGPEATVAEIKRAWRDRLREADDPEAERRINRAKDVLVRARRGIDDPVADADDEGSTGVDRPTAGGSDRSGERNPVDRIDFSAPSASPGPAVTRREGSRMPFFPPWGALLVAWTLRAAVVVAGGVLVAEGLVPAGVRGVVGDGTTAAAAGALAAVAVLSGALPYASRRFAVRRLLRGRGPWTRVLTLLFAAALLLVADAARRDGEPLLVAAAAAAHLGEGVLVFGVIGLVLGALVGSAGWGTALGVLAGVGAVLTPHGPPSVAVVTEGLSSPWFGALPDPAGATLDALIAVSSALTLAVGTAYGVYLGLYGNYRDELDGDRLALAPVAELLVLAPLGGLAWVAATGAPVRFGGLAVGVPGLLGLLAAGALAECLAASALPGRIGE